MAIWIAKTSATKYEAQTVVTGDISNQPDISSSCAAQALK